MLTCKRRGPAILEMHPGTSCPLDCTFCFRQGKGYGAARPPLDTGNVDDLLNEFLALGGRTLNISGGLEPLNRPAVVCQALMTASRLGLNSKVYTNGVAPALSRPRVREVLACYANELRFSIHGITEATFWAVERPASRHTTLKTAIDNVLAVARVRPLGRGARIGVGFVVGPLNVAELMPAAEFWRDKHIDFLDIRADINAAGTLPTSVKRALDLFCRQVEASCFAPLKVHIGDRIHGEPSFPAYCYAPYEKLVVDPFGIVWTCCRLAHPGLRPSWARMGDLSVESLATVTERVWNCLPLPHCSVCTPWESDFNTRVCSEPSCERGRLPVPAGSWQQTSDHSLTNGGLPRYGCGRTVPAARLPLNGRLSLAEQR